MELTGQSKNSIILSLSHLMLKQGKRYCFPSQAKLCEILGKYYGNPIHRRALNYHLRHLEDREYIKRKRRIKRGPEREDDLCVDPLFSHETRVQVSCPPCEFIQEIKGVLSFYRHGPETQNFLKRFGRN